VAGVGGVFAAGSPSRLLLAVVATAAVAAAFQPLQRRLQRLANRLVYGASAGPYEVLAEFTAGLDAGRQTADLLPTMARLLAAGTRSEGASVWLPEATGEVPAACWPADEVAAAPATRSVSVAHGGEHLGRLAVHRRSGQPLAPTEERLMDGLALHAGLVLKNTGLQQELRQRLRELHASRLRLVAAQDEEQPRRGEVRFRHICRTRGFFPAGDRVGIEPLADARRRLPRRRILRVNEHPDCADARALCHHLSPSRHCRKRGSNPRR